MNRFRPTIQWVRLRRAAVFALFAGLALAGCDEQSSEGAADDESASAEESTSEEQPDGTSAESESEKSPEAARAENKEEPPELLRGRITPGRVTELYPRWRKRVEEVEVAEEDAEALAGVDPGAEVTVYLGTWCPDSRREVTRLWKALRLAGGDVPFSVEYVGLDHDFNAGDVSLKGKNVQFVPTFVVRRDGEEVGRIVEAAPDGIERDLHALLSGEKSGVVSKRDDL